MPTSTKGRAYHTQQVHYLRTRLTAAQIGSAGSQIYIGTLPAGSIRYGNTLIHVKTVFSDNQQLHVGSSGDGGYFHSAVSLASGKTELTSGALGALTSDMDVFAKLTSQSTAGAVGIAAGEFEIIIPYVPENDNLQRSTKYDT